MILQNIYNVFVVHFGLRKLWLSFILNSGKVLVFRDVSFS